METHHQPRQMYANHKMCLDHAKIEAYLAGKNIYPRTIEIDLINRCSRACPACPSAGSTMPPAVLTDRFVDRLLGILEGETHGVILSGGEPTISPYFAEIMRIARQRQFQEVAVITNGSELERPEIQAALLEYGTSVRVSLYDWYDGDEPKTYFFKQLERIAGLRRRVEETGSRLEIGVSLLTSRRRLPALLRAVGPAGGSGAHWVYFHPLCQNWLDGVPVQEDQAGVLPVLLSLRENAPPGVNVYVPEQRYTSYPLVFTSFHAAHFLMQIGANGVNYIAPEAKYDAGCALVDLHEDLADGFLWRPRRLAAIGALNSENYRFKGTRHRGAMFSDFLESCVLGEAESTRVARTTREEDFCYPQLC